MALRVREVPLCRQVRMSVPSGSGGSPGLSPSKGAAAAGESLPRSRVRVAGHLTAAYRFQPEEGVYGVG